MTNILQNLSEDIRNTDEYAVEGLILSFTEGLTKRMNERCMSKADLARQLGVSAAYIHAVFSGQNFSLKTMVKLAKAVDLKVNIVLFI